MPQSGRKYLVFTSLLLIYSLQPLASSPKLLHFCHCKLLVSGGSFLREKPLPHRELFVVFVISRRGTGLTDKRENSRAKTTERTELFE